MRKLDALRGPVARLSTIFGFMSATAFLGVPSASAGGVHSRVLSINQSLATANSYAASPVHSPGGSLVAFTTSATNLAPGANGKRQIQVLDKVTQAFEIVSRAQGAGGSPGNAQSSSPDFSLNGVHVVFNSTATNLVQSVTGGHIYLRDRVTFTTELVSIAGANTQDPHAPANRGVTDNPPRISANGCRVVFTSQSSNLDPNWPDCPTCTLYHVFLRDRCEDRTVLLSRPLPGHTSTGESKNPVISRDGRYVAFVSSSTSLPQADGSSDQDVFIYDVLNEAIIQRLDFDGIIGASLNISGDGRFIVGITAASKVAEDTNSLKDVYLTPIDTQNFELLSLNADGTLGAGYGVSEASVSDDGRFVAFTTERDLTGELSTPQKSQVWVRDREYETVSLISRHHATGTGGVNYGSGGPRISASGNEVLFTTHENLDPRDFSFAYYQAYESSGLALETLDPNPELLSDGAVTTELDRLKEFGRPVIGLAADGVTRLLLRYRTSSTGTVRFSITDDKGSPSEDIGTLSSIGGSQNAPDSIEVPIHGFPGGEKYAFAVLKAPESFDREAFAASDHDLSERGFNILVEELEDLGDGTVKAGATFQTSRAIARPPVVLLHGLWSERTTWTYPILNGSPFRFFAHDYREHNASPFASNALLTAKAIDTALRGMRASGLAATQVDFLGHSMGGLLGRQWASGDHCRGCYRGDRNFNDGDFNKLMTLGTPHLGAELATVLIFITQVQYPEWRDFLLRRGVCVDCGAVADLMPTSSEIQFLGEAIAPAHAIAATGGSVYKVPLFEYLLADLEIDIDTVFGTGMLHDFIVSLPSQLGGLEASATTVVGPTPSVKAIHTTETKEAIFGQHLGELLRLPPGSIDFSPSFPPSSASIFRFPAESPPPAPIVPTVCQISLRFDPEFPHVVHPGDSLTVVATGEQGFAPTNVQFWMNGDAFEDLETPFSAEFTVPMDALGFVKFDALARGLCDEEELFLTDSEDVPVTQPGYLAALEIEPPSVEYPLLVPEVDLVVSGRFSDGIVRRLPASALQFESSDTAVATVDSLGRVRLLQRGFAAVTVQSGSVSAAVPVNVQVPPIGLSPLEVSPSGASLLVNRFTPLQALRVFGSEGLGEGSTAVVGCERLHLDLPSAELLFTAQHQDEQSHDLEIFVPFPENVEALAIQVVSTSCAISNRIVVEVPTP